MRRKYHVSHTCNLMYGSPVAMNKNGQTDFSKLFNPKYPKHYHFNVQSISERPVKQFTPFPSCEALRPVCLVL